MLILTTTLVSNVIGRDVRDFDADGVTSWLLLKVLNQGLEGHNMKVLDINNVKILEYGEKPLYKGRHELYLISAALTLDNDKEMESLTRIKVSRQINRKTTAFKYSNSATLYTSKNNSTYKKELMEGKKWVKNNSN